MKVQGSEGKISGSVQVNGSGRRVTGESSAQGTGPSLTLEPSKPESFLGGSWVVLSGVISRVSILTTHNRVLITQLITTHEPPSGCYSGKARKLHEKGSSRRWWYPRFRRSPYLSDFIRRPPKTGKRILPIVSIIHSCWGSFRDTEFKI